MKKFKLILGGLLLAAFTFAQDPVEVAPAEAAPVTEAAEVAEEPAASE